MLKHKTIFSEKTISLFSHILNVQSLWNCRIENEKMLFSSAWTVRALSEMERKDSENFFDSVGIINRYDLQHPVTYTTFKGDLFTHSVLDILYHIINHSTYHRGQIALEFRKGRIDPLLTDYIYFKMKGESFSNGD